MLSTALYLIATLDCSQPRVRFEQFFQATQNYELSKPPLPADKFVLDLVTAGAKFFDYAADYQEKCGVKR